MKVIYQHDRRDCGAACVGMIADFYGLKLSLASIREYTKTDSEGTNIYGLIDGASKIGLVGNALCGSSQELLEEISNGKIAFPFIAHIVSDTGFLHFVVVYKYHRGKFYIADPDKGKYKMDKKCFFECWTGNIVTYEKGNNFVPGNQTKGVYKKYFNLLKGLRGKLIGVFFISLVISAIGICGSLVFQLVIDNFSIKNETHNEEICEEDHDHSVDLDEGLVIDTEDSTSPIESFLNQVAELVSKSGFSTIFVCLIGLYLLQSLIQIIRGRLIIDVSQKIDIKLILKYYNHIIDLPVSSVLQRQTGEYLSRYSDASAIRDAISGATLTLMLDSIMVIAAGVILYLENQMLFWISLIMVVIYSIIVLFFRKPIKKSNQKVMENDAKLQSFFKESLDGIETVKATNSDSKIKNMMSSKFMTFLHSVVHSDIISLVQNSLSDTAELIGNVIILWLGFTLVLTNQLSIGGLISFYALLSYFTTPIKNLIQLQPQLQTAFVAAERLDDILEQEIEKHNIADNDFPIIETIDFCNIDFRYGNRELLLEDLNISLKKGEKIALVGESGSGKTTIAKLLLNFYSPESGEIKINGKPIQNLDLSQLRNNVAYVDQNTFLFADTIRNNLKLGTTDASDEDIYKACETANISSFIDSLPMGLDTFIDENGANLSGGQKQRLALARALLKKPQLLILDEATSHLDTITEMSIQNVIMDSCSDLSCIIIAHRLSTIKRCDKIYLLENGTVTECGTHDELLGHNGKYSKLWESYCHS
ncbi:MAG: peptidase domain-containing ABC transporter [Oscillospiraceae bacterium]